MNSVSKYKYIIVYTSVLTLRKPKIVCRNHQPARKCSKLEGAHQSMTSFVSKLLLKLLLIVFFQNTCTENMKILLHLLQRDATGHGSPRGGIAHLHLNVLETRPGNILM